MLDNRCFEGLHGASDKGFTALGLRAKMNTADFQS